MVDLLPLQFICTDLGQPILPNVSGADVFLVLLFSSFYADFFSHAILPSMTHNLPF